MWARKLPLRIASRASRSLAERRGTAGIAGLSSAGNPLAAATALKPHSSVISACEVTIFEKMSLLSAKHRSINLGQGFPDQDGLGLEGHAVEVKEAAADALLSQPNQYPQMMGLPELRQAVAAHFNHFYRLGIDWESETLITAGATEMLAAAIFGLVEPGDEVVLIDPTYDCYIPIIRRAGGIPRIVSVRPPEWDLDLDALARAFGPKTKAIVLNNPQNPSGKVYSARELDAIAELVRHHNTYAICDEVYDQMVFDGVQHTSLLSFPGMRERGIKIGSAGKTFSLTGWKIGYAAGPAAIIQTVARAHQYLTFTVPPNLQRAVAKGLAKDDMFFAGLSKAMEAKRDRLAAGLAAVGFGVVRTAATYFVVADISPLGFTDDVELCRLLTEEAGVTPVPMSAFYQNQAEAPRHYVRFCCAKQDEVLDAAIECLEGYFKERFSP